MNAPKRTSACFPATYSLIALFCVLIPATISCSQSTSPEATTSGGDTGTANSTTGGRTITISVAASAKEVISELATHFKVVHAVEVRINSGPSSSLANQIIAGAPVDIFLSANRAWADEIAKAQLSTRTVPLLTNDIVLVVPVSNEGKIRSPEDLGGGTKSRVALAGETVPAGVYAEQALSQMGLFATLRQQKRIVRGQDVRTALSFVERGEVDCAVVYSTDVLSSDRVKVVYTFPRDSHAPIEYNLVKIGPSRSKLTDLFFEYLHSPQADKVYSKYGFSRIQLPPPVTNTNQ